MKIHQIGSALVVLSTMLFFSPSLNAGDGDVTTVSVPARGRPVVAKIDAQRTIHLLFDSEVGPKYAQSTDGGMTFGAVIPVVGEGQQVSGLEYSAWDMAIGKGVAGVVSKDGRFILFH
jgi:hypothetical protein